MPDTIRLLIADDHAVVRRGLRLFFDLQPDIAVVGEAADGAGAVAQTGELAPDVVLMDVLMPDVDGVEAIAAIRDRNLSAKVLALSSFSDRDRVLAAVRAGAAGYLLKDTEPEALAEGVRAVHRGEPVLCREAVRGVLEEVTGGDRRPEGTVTIVFTDIEGSTMLLDGLGEARARELFARHDEIVRSVVSEYGGSEVEKEGDAFMLAFSSARAALGCAIAAQRRMCDLGTLRVRVGVNTGEVVADQNRLFGRAVFVAARIASKARGEQILTSEVTRTLVGDDGFAFRDRGVHELKGFTGSHRLFEVEWTQSAS